MESLIETDKVEEQAHKRIGLFIVSLVCASTPRLFHIVFCLCLFFPKFLIMEYSLTCEDVAILTATRFNCCSVATAFFFLVVCVLSIDEHSNLHN